MIAEKRKLRRKWQRSRDPVIKTNLNSLSKLLSLSIKEFENKALSTYLSGLSNEKSSDYSLWKATKKIKRPLVQSSPLKMINEQWARTDDQKATAFSEHLAKIFTSESTEALLQDHLPIAENDDIPLCTELNIKEIIKNLSSKKAPGFDLITAEVLVQLPDNIFEAITKIINACFRLKYIPSIWKVAEVIMVPKPGKPPTEVSSYRPISLLPILSKVLEKLFYERLMAIITRKNLIPSHQFGFRKHHSTIDQIHRITNIIETSFEKKKVCSAVFLDVSQAFDKVWHQGLIYKLQRLLPNAYCEFLSAYLSERVFRVKVENNFSKLNPINAGVPQGSILGPLLFLLYTSDVPTSSNYYVASFADDTALLCTGDTVEESTTSLQTAVNAVSSWTKRWNLKLNNSKSVHIDFSHKQIERKHLFIDNIQIPYSNSAKYLGMTLDTKLRWKEHVKKKRQELDIKFAKLYWLLGKKSKVSTQNKILIYKQVLMPVWTYGIQLWGCASKSTIQTIQKFQNKALRIIMDVPWYVRDADLQRDMGIDPVRTVIFNYATAHKLRLMNHPNDEASKLVEEIAADRRLLRIRPLDLINSDF